MFKTSNLYQNDPQWKDTKLGNQASETIGSWGCLLTSITMMLNAAGYNETPATANEKLKQGGGFDSAMLIPCMVPYVFPNVSLRAFEPCEGRAAPTAQMDAALAAGKPIIVCVDWNPKEEGVQTHWVLLKEKKDNDYLIYDPYQYRGDAPGKDLLLTSRYKFQGNTPEQAISAVFWFEMAGQAAKPPEKTKLPVPAEKFMVFAVEDDLAFRADPSVSGYLLRRLAAATPLIVLETRAPPRPRSASKGSGSMCRIRRATRDLWPPGTWRRWMRQLPRPRRPPPRRPRQPPHRLPLPRPHRPKRLRPASLR